MEGCNSKLLTGTALTIPQFYGWTIKQNETWNRKAGKQSEIRTPEPSFTRQKLSGIYWKFRQFWYADTFYPALYNDKRIWLSLLSTVFLYKLSVAQVVAKFSTLFGTWGWIILFTKYRRWSPFWVIWIRSKITRFLSLRFMLIKHSHKQRGLSAVLLALYKLLISFLLPFVLRVPKISFSLI